MYQKLSKSGWRWSSGASKLANYTYFNPGIKTIKDGKHGRDYFFSEEELKLYITNNYGWIGPENNTKKKPKHQKKKSNNCLRTNDSEKKMSEEEKLNSTIEN